MKRLIQQWLGITDIFKELVLHYGLLKRIHNEMESYNTSNAKLRPQIQALLTGTGRIIAKLEPLYAEDEQDKSRKAESDRLGEEVINRLIAEDRARRHTLGEP